MRVTNAPASRERRRRVLKLAKGYFGPRSKTIRQAYNAVDRAMAMAYGDRKRKKRLYRSLWTVRINAACAMEGLAYSRFIRGLKEAKVGLNRKMLSEIALNDPEVFKKIVAIADKALPAKVSRPKR